MATLTAMRGPHGKPGARGWIASFHMAEPVTSTNADGPLEALMKVEAFADNIESYYRALEAQAEAEGRKLDDVIADRVASGAEGMEGLDPRGRWFFVASGEGLSSAVPVGAQSVGIYPDSPPDDLGPALADALTVAADLQRII